MAATAVTLNDLEGRSPVAGLFKCNSSNICAARCQLTVCSHGFSVLAELLVVQSGLYLKSYALFSHYRTMQFAIFL